MSIQSGPEEGITCKSRGNITLMVFMNLLILLFRGVRNQSWNLGVWREYMWRRLILGKNFICAEDWRMYCAPLLISYQKYVDISVKLLIVESLILFRFPVPSLHTGLHRWGAGILGVWNVYFYLYEVLQNLWRVTWLGLSYIALTSRFTWYIGNLNW